MAKAFPESIEHALLYRVPTMIADWAGVLYEYLSIALGHMCIVRGWRASIWEDKAEAQQGKGTKWIIQQSGRVTSRPDYIPRLLYRCVCMETRQALTK